MDVSQPLPAGFKTCAAVAKISVDYDSLLLHPPQSSINGGPAEPGGDFSGSVINLFARRMLGSQAMKSRPDRFSLAGVFQTLLAKEMPQVVFLKMIAVLKFQANKKLLPSP